TQWGHYWGDLKNDPLQRWAISPLRYLHQRRVAKAASGANTAGLGYGAYAQRPGNGGAASSMDGNDTLLRGLCWLTHRD
ncbi:hypothetical protein ACV35P_30845, partial [Pseudomonas aeruginosa]